MLNQGTKLRVDYPAELESEGLAIVKVEGTRIVVMKAGGQYRAFDQDCPHLGGDLGEGLMFKGNVKCPLHGYIFDMNSGKCLNRGQGGMWLQIYEVSVEDTQLVLAPIPLPLEPAFNSSTSDA